MKMQDLSLFRSRNLCERFPNVQSRFLPQSKLKLCLRHKVSRQRSIEAGRFNIRRLPFPHCGLEARSASVGCDQAD
jgi:hypothetical protein